MRVFLKLHKSPCTALKEKKRLLHLIICVNVVEKCDARDDASSTIDGNIKFNSLILSVVFYKEHIS